MVQKCKGSDHVRWVLSRAAQVPVRAELVAQMPCRNAPTPALNGARLISGFAGRDVMQLRADAVAACRVALSDLIPNAGPGEGVMTQHKRFGLWRDYKCMDLASARSVLATFGG